MNTLDRTVWDFARADWKSLLAALESIAWNEFLKYDKVKPNRWGELEKVAKCHQSFFENHGIPMPRPPSSPHGAGARTAKGTHGAV